MTAEAVALGIYAVVGGIAVLIFANSEARSISPRRPMWARLRKHWVKALVLWAAWPLMVVAKFMEDL